MTDNSNHTFSNQEPGSLRLAGRIVLFIIGCALVLPVAQPFVPKLPGMGSEIILGTVASLWALGLTFFAAYRAKLSLAEIGVAPDMKSPARFAVGFGIGLLIVALWWAVLAASGDITWLRSSDFFSTTTLVTLVAFVVLSCREELAFHGYPLQRLRRAWGIWAAQLFIACLFALEHVAGGSSWPQALLGSGTGSLLFGMAAIASGGLALPIGLHAAWNFGHWSFGHKGRPGIWEAVTTKGSEDHAQFVGMAAYLVVMGFATIAFWWWYRRTSRIVISP